MIKMNSKELPADVTKSERYLHTPSSFAKQNLYYMQEVGKLQSIVPHRCIRENLDSFLILLVLEGQGSLMIKDKEYALVSGDCAFIDCQEHYEHISDAEDAWKLAWVHFNGNSVRAFYELFIQYNNSSNVFHASSTKRIVEVINQLMDRRDQRDLMLELHSSELLQQLLRELIGLVISTERLMDDVDRTFLYEVREFINENYAEADIFELFEQKFSITVEQFDEQFTTHYGISIEEYINNRRFMAAKELLRFSIKSIPEIAKESGIRDVIIMQKMFDDKENMTVEEYRSKWAQWVR